VFSISPLATDLQEAQSIHMTATFTHNVSRVVPHFSSIHLSPQIQLHISMDQELHRAEQFANLIKPLLKSFTCIEQFQSSLCSRLALICIWIHSNLLPFQWIFESIVDNIFAWNNFPCWNEICQLDQYCYHKWMGLNIICYLQHPNQTYIPMSMIL
jgi:hypothetical protein